MKEYIKKIDKAYSKEEIKKITLDAEADENITDEYLEEITIYAEEKIKYLENALNYNEYDKFDDMWHSGEFK